MRINTIIEQAVSKFKQDMLLFCQEAAEAPLTPDTASMFAQGLQKTLAAVGRTAFQTFLQMKEKNQDVVMHHNELFRFKYESEKHFMTLWGKIPVRRRIYQNASDSKTYVPLDAAWGMQEEFMMLEAREAVAFACAYVTPEETNKLLEKTAFFHPHPTQIKRCIETLKAQVATEQAAMDDRIREQEQAPDAVRVLAASADGVNLMLNEPEQAGAKRGRPAQRPGKDNSQASSTAYRNAMVGAISFYGAVPKGKQAPQRLSCRYTSHMPEANAPTFKSKFEAELAAAERQAPANVIKVLLCDGARSLWNYIDNRACFEGYEKIIDYYHTVEHLSLAAEALFGKGSGKAKAWYAKYRKQLLEKDDGARSVLRSMDYYSSTRALSKSRAEAVSVQRTFFERNQGRMTYAAFRRRGLPIGSGPVEAACKTIVKTRMCRSGMRWSRKGGQRILDLRTYVLSNRWDAFWNEYKKLLRAV